MGKKIYIGGYGACDVNNYKYVLTLYEDYLEEKGVEVTTDFSKADDIILIDTCSAITQYSELFFEALLYVNIFKKTNANIIISGCATRNLEDGHISDKFRKYYESGDYLKNRYKAIDKYSRIINDELREFYGRDDYLQYRIDDVERIIKESTLVKEDDIFRYFINRYFTRKEREKIVTDIVPFKNTPFTYRISPVRGCIHKCSFCKTNYLNFQLKSIPFELIEEFKSIVSKQEDVSRINIYSSNLSLYGMDLYKRKRAHEVIHTLSEMDNIKSITVGCIIDWYPELIEEIITNKKIQSIDVALETGSERLYGMMNRPIPLNKLKDIFRRIREERPDLLIITEIISGYPTETIEDIKTTIDVIQEFNLYTKRCYTYYGAPLIPSSNEKEHSHSYIDISQRYIKRKIDIINDKINKEIMAQGFLIIEEDEDIYVGIKEDGDLIRINKGWLTNHYSPGDRAQEDIVRNKTLFKHPKETIDL